MPDAARQQIQDCTEVAQLDQWPRRAITARTLAEVVGGQTALAT